MIGEDPALKAKYACKMSNSTWVGALQATMLDPKGLSAWWTDYGGCNAPTPAALPLPSSAGCPKAVQMNASSQELLWSNYVYTSSLSAAGARPLVLSRYGGIGNQRFALGFSGDTQSTWSTLALQVSMTPVAANALFGYWSHDLGGYNIYCPKNGTISPCPCGTVVQPCNLTTGACARAEPELYTRWLQFGALSPIFRSHCSHCDRRIWSYPEPYYTPMAAALHFRHALQPYLYTAAAAATNTSLVALHALYLEWPLLDDAYSYADTQYLLGAALLVAPITQSSSSGSGRGVWVPPGTWLPWEGGEPVVGPAALPPPLTPLGLSQYQIWAKAGAVLAMQPSTAAHGTTVVWVVFGGAAGGEGQLYEDDGVSTSSAGQWLALTHTMAGRLWDLKVGGLQGGEWFEGMVGARRHVLQLRGGGEGRVGTAVCNGESLAELPAPASGEEEDYSKQGWWVVPSGGGGGPWMTAGAVVVVGPVVEPAIGLRCTINYV